MIRPLSFVSSKEPYAIQHHCKRCNPAVMIKAASRYFIIGAGSRDDVEVMKEGDFVFVLSINSRLGYAGLQRFELKDGLTSKELAILNEDQPISEKLNAGLRAHIEDARKEEEESLWAKVEDQENAESVFWQYSQDIPDGFWEMSAIEQLDCLAEHFGY
jgi:hypothetical protein